MDAKFTQPIYVTRPLMPDHESYSQRLKDIWESQWLSNGGEQHKQLEAELVEHLQVPYLSLFNNGTTALTVAIQALRLQGEVITTPFSFPATTHALAWNNITPVFCDIEPTTMTIDPSQIERHITNKTSAILGVHVYGVPCFVDEIQRIADRHGLKVVYDAAHAFGTEINGRPIGSYGDISMFSFHPTKLFHTSEGGGLSYNNPHLKERIDLLKNFGIKNEFEVIMPGINGKMNELSALMGRCVLPLVDDERAKRTALRTLYAEELKGVPGIEVLKIPEGVTDSCQHFVIQISTSKFGKNRDDVYTSLRQNNVYSRKYFYPLISDYPCYHHLPSTRSSALMTAKEASEQVLCLPFYGGLHESEVKGICQIIKAIHRE